MYAIYRIWFDGYRTKWLYIPRIPMPVIQSHDTVLLKLCRSTCTQVCNVRTFGDAGRYIFFNHYGASVKLFTIDSESVWKYDVS